MNYITRLIALATVVVALVFSQSGALVAQSCGLVPFKPFPPFGCVDLVAQCVVDSQGHAVWQWVCVKK